MSPNPQSRTWKSITLDTLAYGLVLAVASSGWALSYRRLHEYGVSVLGETESFAWLVPLTFDLAPLGLSIVVYRARVRAQSAVVWRLGIWAFTALSAWINWTNTNPGDHAQVVAALLPLCAVVLFEGLMSEAHKRALERIYGEGVIPRLTLMCWVLDRERARDVFRRKALRPLYAAEAALAQQSQTEPAKTRQRKRASKQVESTPVAESQPETISVESADYPLVASVSQESPSPDGETARARELLNTNPRLTGGELATALGVSRSKGYRLRKTVLES